MWSTIKKKWRQLRRGPPGRRFQERYERNQRDRASRSFAGRYLPPAIGLVLLAAGVAFSILPGPGLPLLLVGGGLLAGEFSGVARVLDWCEVRLRKLFNRVAGWWKHAPTLERLAVLVITVAAIGAAGYGAYEMILH